MFDAKKGNYGEDKGSDFMSLSLLQRYTHKNFESQELLKLQ
jgi:hypothetical protein